MEYPLQDPNLFLNRELCWLEFNRRVLEEAKDPAHPLLERVKFLGIFSSNLDEFFEIRVAGLKQQDEAEGDFRNPDGMTPREQLAAISLKTHELVEEQYRIWMEEVVPALKAQGLVFLTPKMLTRKDQQWVARYFESRVAPVLTPMAVGPAHPFPLLLNKSLNLALSLVPEGQKDSPERLERLGLVQVPRSLHHLVQLPHEEGGPERYMFLADIMRENVGSLFPGQACLGVWSLRVTRNSNLYVDEDEAENLLEAIESELQKRRKGEAVRLEIEQGASASVLETLKENLWLQDEDVYLVQGPVNLQRLMAAYTEIDRPELKDPPYNPSLPEDLAEAGQGVFALISQNDILLHHPYQSFAPVVDFIAAAATDPQVLAIKQTLYRTSADSPIVQSLIRAAQNGKQVTVLLELKARFEEEKNIHLARMMEEAGVNVVYGIVGLKTHCKVVLVVRQEEEGLKRYVHLGTGNYNPSTARIYTDLSLFSCREDLGRDVAALFNMLTAFSKGAGVPPMQKLLVAPTFLEAGILERIRRETENARAGLKARIVAKMNSLVDARVIAALYVASQAGVSIDLVVRGICCLIPQKKDLSENIRVRSIVDRYLEHSRVYYFENGGEPEVWLGSADWMPRNFERRVEVLFPVDDPNLKSGIIHHVLAVSLADNVKARYMQPDGSYKRGKIKDGEASVRSQQLQMDMAQGKEVKVPDWPTA